MELGVAERLAGHVENPPTNGAAETILHSLGADWRVSYLEQRIKGQLEQRLIHQALRSIVECEELANSLGDDEKYAYLKEAQNLRSQFINNRSAGSYNWMGEVCRKALTDVPGSVYLLFLLLKRCHPDITEEDAYAIYMDARQDANAAVLWALGKEPALAGRALKEKLASQKQKSTQNSSTPE